MLLRPLTLHGARVRLEPLAPGHLPGLAAAGLHAQLWRLQPKAIDTAAAMQEYVERALDDQARGASLPFAVVDAASGAVIGSTRFMDIAPAHRRLEIGATWFTPSFQRTGANVESKLLLLTHAFESLGAQKVVFKTEALNTQSRQAILALGAVEEGTLRRHLLAENGRPRDMVYFSILDDEWPGVKTRLRARLDRATPPG
jgi:RimJ/RimL family protein N-acetyltransferase